MHNISILIVNNFRHGRKYPSLCSKVTTRPNQDPQYSIPVALGRTAQRSMVKSLRKEVWESLGHGQYRSTARGLGELPLLGFNGQSTQGARVRNIKVESKLEWSGRDPKSGLRRKAPTTLGGRRLTDLCRCVRALDLWHNALPSNKMLPAIDAFLGRQDQGEYPVVAVLANIYYTLDYCSMRNGKGLRCCTTLLFLWLTAHLFHSSKKMRCPIEDHYWSCVKLLTKVEWTARLDEATERLI
ncbi:hypothetical protein CR513_15806, partial [Mucuna pruriens]